MSDTMFEVDAEGWIAQHKGRPLEELVREIMQNALDTGSDIRVKIDKNRKTIQIIDDGPGYEDLSDAWSIFGGDKADNPEKRGRFGRGVKEAVPSCETFVIETVGGRVEFDVEARKRTIHEDRGRESGTCVTMKNSEWHGRKDIQDVRDYLETFWPPGGQTITVDIKGGKEYEIEREEPEFTQRVNIPTVVVNDGELTTEYRNTDLHFKDSAGSGVLYEMGIPVLREAEFPYHVDVQQKIPMAEQRNEPDSSWRKTHLLPAIVEAVHDRVPKSQMRENWYTTGLRKSYDSNLQQEFVEEVVQDGRKKDIVTSSNPKADDKCENYGYQVFDTERAGRDVARIVESVTQSASSVAQDLADREKEQVQASEIQERVMAEMEEIASRAGYEDVSVELWHIEDGFNDEHTKAQYNGESHAIRLNEKHRDWDELNEKNLSTLIHELGHIEYGNHSTEWADATHDIAAKIILNHGA
ncbi:MAG: ATP-binding protein [Halopenitus sp.]